jgi:hypothetical protein
MSLLVVPLLMLLSLLLLTVTPRRVEGVHVGVLGGDDHVVAVLPVLVSPLLFDVQ